MSVDLNEAPCDICLCIVHDEDAAWCETCGERVCKSHMIDDDDRPPACEDCA